MAITSQQYAFLVRPMDPDRVQKVNNQAHLEQWDVRRHLIRVFGFGGWDFTVLSCEMISHVAAEKNGRTGHTVVYRVLGRLTIKNTDGSALAFYEDGATGDSINQPSLGNAHDLAMKTAISQALKRCAINLGDAFGLGLYNGGRTDAVVVRSLVAPADPPVPIDVPEDEPVQPEPGTVVNSEQESLPERLASPAAAAGAVKDRIKLFADAMNQTLEEVAADFHGWSNGVAIRECEDVAMLKEYLAGMGNGCGVRGGGV